MAEDATQPGGAVALAAVEEVPQRNDETAVGQRNGISADAPVVERRHTTTADMRAWAARAGAPAAAPAAPTQDAGAVARFEQAATGAKKLISKTASAVSPQKVVLAGSIDGKPGFILTRRSKEVVEVSLGGPPLEYWKRAGGRSTVPKEQPAYIRLEMVYVLRDGKARWSKQHGDAVCRQSATCWRVACARVRLVGVWRVLANLITLNKIRARARDQHGGGAPAATPGAGGGVSEGGS